MRRGFIWIVGILIVSLLLGGGLWVWMTSAFNGHGPQIQNISVDPSLLRFPGGTVTVRARVTSDVGVARVGGSVMQGASEYRRLPTQNHAVNSQEIVYVTEFPAPANTRNDGVAVDYLVRLVAVDSTGQESVTEAAFQVAAPALPPAPPFTNSSP